LKNKSDVTNRERTIARAAKRDIGKSQPPSQDPPIQAESPEQKARNEGDKQDMRDMDVSFIRLKSATASRTITQMRAGTVVRVEEKIRSRIAIK